MIPLTSIQTDGKTDDAKVRELLAVANEMAKALWDDVVLLEREFPRPARNGEIARSRAALSRAKTFGGAK